MVTQITVDISKMPWHDLKDKCLDGSVERIGALPMGMESGEPAVAIMVRAEDGQIVVGQMSLRHFQMAAAAFKGRYGDVT